MFDGYFRTCEKIISVISLICVILFILFYYLDEEVQFPVYERVVLEVGMKS